MGGPAAERSRADQLLGVRLPARAEVFGILIRQRALVCRAEQVGAEDQRALVVEDRRLHASLQEVLRVTAEELVQRVLSCQVEGQASSAPAGPTPHLAQRGDRAGKGHNHRGVQLADVDAELQRVGRDHRAQLAAHQAALELAPLLGGVAGAVGGDQLRQLAVRARELFPHQPAQQLHRLARLDEADRARAVAHEPCQQLSRLG